MIFETNKYGNCVNINLGSNILNDVKSYKYHGHIINKSLSDDEDMKAKERSLFYGVLSRRLHGSPSLLHLVMHFVSF